MHVDIFTLDRFLSEFKFRKSVTFNQFSKELKVIKYTSVDGSDCVSFDSYIKKNPTRGRKERERIYRENLYRILVKEPEEGLSVWFERFGKLQKDLPYYFSFPETSIKEDNIFWGNINGNYGNVCRSLNFVDAHKTVKTNVGEHAYRPLLTDFKLMYEKFIINYRLPTPAFFDIVCNFDEWGYKEFWKHLMLYLNKPSILNPYTYREILHELFTGETLFAPCMSWNSCQVAFYNSHFSHFISTDVIPSVVENGRNLHLDWQDWNNGRAVLFPEDKTIDLYCCPSEQLQKRHKFVNKYRNKVDAVLFCPPYFDLELYDSPEQSVDSFPDYIDWLRGYWEETVKTCTQVMRPGARFGFIISNYSHDCGKTLIPVSDDMANITKKHLSLVERYGLRWNNPVQKKKSVKMKDGHVEDIWLFEKR